MKRAGILLLGLLLSTAALSPIVADVVGASPAAAASGSTFNCPSWSVGTPYAAFAVIGADGSATCVMPFNNFGDVIGIVKRWAFERDGKYHLLAQGTATSHCSNYGQQSICNVKAVHAQTAVYPPAGNYHAELEMIGGYASQAPGLSILDDANSGGFCYYC